MTPINGILYGLFFSTCSRIACGELDLAEGTVEKVEVVRDRLEEFSNLVGDLSPDKPGSWSRFAGRLMERTFDTRRLFESAR